MKVYFSTKTARLLPFMLVLFLPMLFSASCKSKKMVVAAIDNTNVNREDKKQVFKAIDDNRFEFDYLSSSASCNYEGTAGKYNFNVSVRMQRNEKIWMSVSIFFIEAARIYITKDSVHIINYLENYSISRNIDFLAQYTGQKLTVGQLQDIMVGNSIITHDAGSSYVYADGRPRITTRMGQYLFVEEYHYEYFRPTKVNGDEAAASNKMELEYDEFIQVNNRLLPNFLKLLAVTNTQNISATLKYSDISTETITNWPFKIPAKYERK